MKRKPKPVPILPLSKTYKLKREDDIEAIIRLVVKAQERFRKEGCQLEWHMTWRPCPPVSRENGK